MPLIAPGLARAAPESFQRVSASYNSTTLEFDLPPYRVETTAEGCQLIVVAGYGELTSSLGAVVPSTGLILGIPRGSVPTLHLETVQSEPLPGRYRLCGDLEPLYELDGDGRMTLTGSRHALVESKDQFSPTEPIMLGEDGWIRSQRVITVRFAPFQYNPATGQVWVTRHARGRIDHRATGMQSFAQENDEPFDPILDDLLANPSQARGWRQSDAPLSPLAASVPVSLETNRSRVRLAVSITGLYEITYEDLVSAGIPLTGIPSAHLRLLDGQEGLQEVALWVKDDDGQFGAGDSFLFYGQAPRSIYARENVYWLFWEGPSGLRMESHAGDPNGTAGWMSEFRAIEHQERNTRYISSISTAITGSLERDHWFMDALQAVSKPVTRSYTFTLKNLSTTAQMITVRGLMQSYQAKPQHRTRFALNGTILGETHWPVNSTLTFSYEVPQSLLKEGENTLTLTLPLGDGITQDISYLNWFEVEYGRRLVSEGDRLFFRASGSAPTVLRVEGFSTNVIDALDVTNPLRPVRISGAVLSTSNSTYTLSFGQSLAGERAYLALSPSRRLKATTLQVFTPSVNLRTADQADYLLITPAAFLEAAERLAAFHESRGLRVNVVKVEEIYNQFNGGLLSPEAIREFVAYTMSHWQKPAPSYLLLLGDGTYDFKNYLNRIDVMYIPPYLAEVDQWIKETAADNRFAAVIGEDSLPDLAVGRLPARSLVEANSMVDKIIAYQNLSYQSPWAKRVLFLADNPDSINFTQAPDRLVAQLPAAFHPEKVYLGTTHLSAADARAAFLNAFKAGSLFTVYSGHGSFDFWADEPLFSKTDLPSLTNQERQTIVLSLTCLDGYFIHASTATSDFSSIEESLVRLPGSGSVAAISPTGFSLANGHELLAGHLFDAVFSDARPSLGQAVVTAKLKLMAQVGGYIDLVDTYMLFGDPALQLPLPPPPQPAPSPVPTGTTAEPTAIPTLLPVEVTVTAAFPEPSPTETLMPQSTPYIYIFPLVYNQ